MKKSKIVALSGIMTALSVIFLFLGSSIWILGYVMPIVCSIMMIILIDIGNKKTAILTFFATSIISLLLLSDKECSLFYALFFGYYPIVRDCFSKVKIKFLSFVLKLVVFNISMAIIQLLCVYVFGIPFDNIFGKWGIVLFFLALNVIFVAYDKLYSSLVILYNMKIRPRISKYFR